jgi:hypothetical protein
MTSVPSRRWRLPLLAVPDLGCESKNDAALCALPIPRVKKNNHPDFFEARAV